MKTVTTKQLRDLPAGTRVKLLQQANNIHCGNANSYTTVYANQELTIRQVWINSIQLVDLDIPGLPFLLDFPFDRDLTFEVLEP